MPIPANHCYILKSHQVAGLHFSVYAERDIHHSQGVNMTDKAEAKLNEAAGAVQEKFGEFTGSRRHQARGAARRYPAQASYAVQDAADCVVRSVRDNPATGWPLPPASA
jgi:Uncharacterized protein conserved in bacteria